MTCREFRQFWDSNDSGEFHDLDLLVDVDEHYGNCEACYQWIVYKDLFSNPQITIPAIRPSGPSNS
jgi:predicted anti-sigma-YlaC factor YlaD